MNNWDSQSVPKRNESVAHRIIEGNALVVMPRDATMMKFNEVGTKIWNLLGDRTLEQIAQALTEEFEVTFEEALSDTEEFISSLEQRGLIEISKNGGAT